MTDKPPGSMVAQAEAYDARSSRRLGYIDGARGVAILCLVFVAFAGLPFSAAEKIVFDRLGRSEEHTSELQSH